MVNLVDAIMPFLKDKVVKKQKIFYTKYLCCCPFHHEKTASFFFTKDGYRCLGCGKIGNLLELYQHLKNKSEDQYEQHDTED